MSKEQLLELITQAVSEHWAGQRLDDLVDQIHSLLPANKPVKAAE